MTERIAGSPFTPKRLARAALLLALVGTAFLYGIGVGVRHWPPYGALRAVRNSLRSHVPAAPYGGEGELLGFAFSDPLLPSEMVYPPIHSLRGIEEANQSVLLDAGLFSDAYRDLELIAAETLRLDGGATKLLRVTYTLGGREHEAFAYSDLAGDGSRAAVLVIPGTGSNQSDAIRKEIGALDPFGRGNAPGSRPDLYVFIKPNQDCLAFQDGRGRLRREFMVNWHLNHGGSYSAVYIVGSLAVMKHLQAEYETTAVAGVSQGGMAALLNALQSRPDAAVVASGFSVLSDRVRSADHDQLIIPGIWTVLTPEEIRERIRNSSTKFLFTYGRAERGTYRIEAEENLTQNFLGDLANVRFVTHAGGHVFPWEVIGAYLADVGASGASPGSSPGSVGRGAAR